MTVLHPIRDSVSSQPTINHPRISIYFEKKIQPGSSGNVLPKLNLEFTNGLYVILKDPPPPRG